MDSIGFVDLLSQHVDHFSDVVSTPEGDWVVKGFIDIARNIYTLSVDTKVISKIMELLLLPELARFAAQNDLRMILCEHQNHYPDITFVDSAGNKFALDLKSTYRKSKTRVNGMTLGAFTGYFRERDSTKNCTFPYGAYKAHVVLGVIYTKSDNAIDERHVYGLEALESIASVVRNFKFFVQEKYRIASDRPGSGNTKNIGSVTTISQLVAGRGPFGKLGIEVFDDYWMYYLTRDMARAVELPNPPYSNLRSYLKYKGASE